VLAIRRVSAVVNWSPGFRTGTGVASQRYYLPNQDPLNPNGGAAYPPPLDSIPATIRKMVK